jgi:hypothetical protein
LFARPGEKLFAIDIESEREGEREFSNLLHALVSNECELCLTPMGNQGLIWTNGDIDHYWKYVVNPSLKVSKSSSNERSDLYGDQYANRFYTPVPSTSITGQG